MPTKILYTVIILQALSFMLLIGDKPEPVIKKDPFCRNIESKYQYLIQHEGEGPDSENTPTEDIRD